MLKTRLIARMDIKGENLIKPINLEGLRVVGKPQIFAERYNQQGIDELLFMDAVASLYGRNNLGSLLETVSQNVFVPITAGGGVRSVDDVRALLRSGADKVAINTAVIQRPELITEVANACGSQCMVLQIDAKAKNDSWEAYIDGGREHTGKDAIEWAVEGVRLGAGEILLTSIDREGTRSGYDLSLIREVSRFVNVPVVASGGAGTAEHLVEAIQNGADAVAVADILHYGRVSLDKMRETLQLAGVQVR